MANLDVLFEPLEINGLRIRNRLLSTSHAPAYAVGGRITSRYVRYQAEKARGGVGLTQFGGATAVAPENSFYYGQINGASEEVVPGYRAMAAAIHEHGACCTVQLTHGGRRERWDLANWLPVFSSSCRREAVHGSFPAEMEDHDLARVAADYAAAARRVREGDVDGVEISCQAGTLIEQFWSPLMNFRRDGYGGSLGNRMRLGLEILEAVRRAVGDDFVVGIRMPGDELTPGGLTGDDCAEIASHYAARGLADYVSVVGGHGSTVQDEARIWPTMWVPGAAYLALAKAIKEAVPVPILHATRITDAATAAHALRSGSLDMVGMTRALIADPHLPDKLRTGREAEIRPCVGAGYCVDRVIEGQDALCMHNVAAGREETLGHEIAPSAQGGKKVVVIGGGPGGLEAARVAARRGHRVVLFEAAPRLGGQLVLAARAPWRRELGGIVDWLSGQLRSLAVDVRPNHLAGADDVEAEDPDVVIVATGGSPVVGHFDGRELATTTWEVLAGEVSVGESVLVVDESGGHPGMSCAAHLAARGARVEIVTPDKALGRELGGTNLGAYMTELYRAGVTIRPDTRVDAVRRDGNRLAAVVTNVYGGGTETLIVDQLVGDYGTTPNDALYRELKARSRNLGALRLDALAASRTPFEELNPHGAFWLARIGDAWTSRNVHAAMLDAMRVTKDL